jgi:streptogramin lyase
MNVLSKYRLSAAMVLLTFAISIKAQVGTWANYLSYADITDVVKGGSVLYVLASGNLFSYSTSDESVVTYDKANTLSDTQISHIAWCSAQSRLVIVYADENIDLLNADGTTVNISDLYSKTMTEDKTVNDIYISGSTAYLSTGFGIVKVNVKNAEISDSYNLGFSIDHSYISNNTIYAASPAKGLYAAGMSGNLLDKSNWKRVGDYTAKTRTVDADLLALAKKYQPNSPVRNEFYSLLFSDGILYSTAGCFVSGEPDYAIPGTVQMMNSDGNWTKFEDNLSTVTGYDYLDDNCMAIDPTDKKHIFVGGRCGLYEFYDGTFKKAYNQQNSPLNGAIDGNKELGNNFTLVNGLTFDAQGNLWILNSQAVGSNIIELKTDGTFTSHYSSELLYDGVGLSNMSKPFFDSRGLLWFVNNHFYKGSLICYNTSTNQIKVYSSFVNEDGTIVGAGPVRCAAEDPSGNIWIGTSTCPLVLMASQITSGGEEFYQPKVPRNDGTNLADYLLSGVDVTSISIDGGGRIWIGTSLLGVYLIDSDGTTQLQHFTQSNSPLINDEITSICINGKSGKVYFGSMSGLCSYISDATTPSQTMTADSVWAYPNPVTPDYTGLVTVTGLTVDADVKIVTSAGTLVASGKSSGGTFTWDCNDNKGRRVASGVYFVVTATADGSKGVVTKIAVVN